jgi:phage host-nuclease inhibitor protein Gam
MSTLLGCEQFILITEGGHMATKKEPKTKRAPKAFWELSKLMYRLARNTFAQSRINFKHNMKVALLEKERDRLLAAEETERQALIAEITSFAMNNKAKFGEKKKVTLVTGEVGFRSTAASAKIAEGQDKAPLFKRLKRHYSKFLRITVELNKEAIHEAHKKGEKIPKGIVITGGEEFFISLEPRGNLKPKVITSSVSP